MTRAEFVDAFPGVAWFSLLAVLLLGYARCARLSGVPLKAAFRPCWAIVAVWPLLALAILFVSELAPGFWDEKICMLLTTSAPGAAALFLLSYLRERAVKDVPVFVEVLLVAVSSGLGFAFVRSDHASRALKMIFTIRKNALFGILGQGKSGVKGKNFCSWQGFLECAHYLGLA